MMNQAPLPGLAPYLKPLAVVAALVATAAAFGDLISRRGDEAATLATSGPASADWVVERHI